ncbi:MAG: protein-disulfide reductase DsbD [Candidatus Berkiella sp.]
MPKNTTKHNLVIYLIFILCLCAKQASADPLSSLGIPKVVPLEAAFVLELSHQDNILKANWQIAPSCYLYQNSIQFNITIDNQNQQLPVNDFPEGIVIDDPTFGKQITYQQMLDVDLNLSEILKKENQSTAMLTVAYQGCAKSGFCYPPVEKYFELTISNHQLQAINISTTKHIADAHSKDHDSPIILDDVSHLAAAPTTAFGYLSSIGTFYLFGLLLTFTPCVWPMIPILAGIIVGQSHLNTKKAFWLSLCYVLSMAFSYALAGIIAATLGKNLQASLQHPAIIISFSVLFALLGLMQLGIIRINMPAHFRLKDILHALHAKQESGTYIGAAIMGVLATLISSPCVTPALIFALGYISHSGNVLLGGSALLAMGLGMGTILLGIGTLGGKFLPRSGAWMHHVNQVFAIIMFGLSIWMLSRFYQQAWILVLWGLLSLFIAWCMNTFKKSASISARLGMLFVVVALFFFWGAFQGYKEPLQVFSFLTGHTQQSTDKFQTVTTKDELENLLEKARVANKPALVDFYADWCVACRHMEHEVFEDQAVLDQLKNWELIRVNVTTFNSEAESLLKKFDLIGPPAVLFFSPNASELTKYRIIGEVSKKQFLAQLAQISQD